VVSCLLINVKCFCMSIVVVHVEYVSELALTMFSFLKWCLVLRADRQTAQLYLVDLFNTSYVV